MSTTPKRRKRSARTRKPPTPERIAANRRAFEEREAKRHEQEAKLILAIKATPPDGVRARPGVTTVRYEVTFRYVESEYARQRGIEEVAYRGQVDAASPEEAIAAAERMFQAAERSSGVSWPRTIKSTACRRLHYVNTVHFHGPTLLGPLEVHPSFPRNVAVKE
jgi:hypothetical protein